jgi:hypothetical protein
LRVSSFKPAETLKTISIFANRKLDLWIILTIGFINAFCLTPSITNSLGITSLEDGPIQPSLVFENPSAFINDFHASEFQRLMWTTSTKWLPALFYKYLSIDPVVFHVALTYSQTILMLVGTFYLASALTYSRLVSYVSVCFVVMFSPYFNNFASYGDQFFMPYATWISIGPLLIAWAYSINGKKSVSLVWLAIAASIHPAMALCATFAIAGTSIKHIRPLKSSIFNVLQMFSPSVFFSLISAVISFLATAQNVPANWYESTREVLHWYAWKLNPADEITFETTSYAFVLILTALVISNARTLNLSTELQNRIKRVSVIFMFMFLAQAISYQLNIRLLYSISFGRFSIFSAIFVSIVFATVISQQIQRKSGREEKSGDALLVYFLLVPSFVNLALLAILIFFREYRAKLVSRFYYFPNLLFAVVFVLFARANFNNSWFEGSWFNFVPNGIRNVPNYLPLKMLENISPLFWILVIVLVIFYSFQKKAILRALTVFVVILSFTLITLVGRFILSERRDATHLDWINTQVWAQSNTPKESRFIVNSGFDVYESWTTLSKRPRLIADLSAGFLYFYTKEDAQYDALRSKLPAHPSGDSELGTLTAFYNDFRLQVGGDYLVWKNSDTKLNYPIEYSNSKFTIYSLK